MSRILSKEATKLNFEWLRAILQEMKSPAVVDRLVMVAHKTISEVEVSHEALRAENKRLHEELTELGVENRRFYEELERAGMALGETYQAVLTNEEKNVILDSLLAAMRRIEERTT